jgi:hypothetical protein
MLTPAVRGADPRAFAMVMAAGIVSVALRQAGSPGLSAALFGTEAGVPLIREVGTAGAWVAAAVWAAVFAWMLAWPIARWRSASQTAPGR